MAMFSNGMYMPSNMGGDPVGANPTYDDVMNGVLGQLGGSGAVAGGAVEMAPAVYVDENYNTLTGPNANYYQGYELGYNKVLYDPVSGLPLYLTRSVNPGGGSWLNALAAGGPSFGPPTGGYGGGYGGGGGGGFDYDKAKNAWYAMIDKIGFNDQTRQGDWGRAYMGQALNDWQAKNPEGTPDGFKTYINSHFGGDNGGLDAIYNGLDPARRGDNYSAWAGSGRTISWG